jgi:hypothetical protein
MGMSDRPYNVRVLAELTDGCRQADYLAAELKKK